MSVTATQKQRALRGLDRMADIVNSERLVHGSYVQEAEENACGRNRYCAIGSAMAGYGARIKTIDELGGEAAALDFTAPWFHNNPGFKVMLEALEEESQRYLKQRGWYASWPAPSRLEALFEARLANDDTEKRRFRNWAFNGVFAVPGKRSRRTLLTIIRRARKRVSKLETA